MLYELEFPFWWAHKCVDYLCAHQNGNSGTAWLVYTLQSFNTKTQPYFLFFGGLKTGDK